MPGVLPPKDLSADRLFRLVTNPRPVVPIAYRVRGAEALPLSVRAVTAREWAECLDDASDADVTISLDPRSIRASASLVARSLLAGGRRAFACAEDVLGMSDDELSPLAIAVLGALDRMSPARGRRDEGAWHTELRKGALDPSNATDAFALGTSFDIGGSIYLDRPERFYGIPAIELTDGHWLAYRVCRRLVEESIR